MKYGRDMDIIRPSMGGKSAKRAPGGLGGEVATLNKNDNTLSIFSVNLAPMSGVSRPISR